jgi:hypothetical protein
MRAAAAAMILAAWIGQASAASSELPQGVSPEDAHAGCMHTDLRPCMISIGSALWFDMNLVTRELARRNELDVNGRTAHRIVHIPVKVPNTHEVIEIALTLASPAPNDLVVKAEIVLPIDPELARTEAEYDKTFLYKIVSVLLGRKCPNLDKLALYRFYENELKPYEIVETETLKSGMFTRTRIKMHTDPRPFCGVMFSLRRQEDINGTPEFYIPPKPAARFRSRWNSPCG